MHEKRENRRLAQYFWLSIKQGHKHIEGTYTNFCLTSFCSSRHFMRTLDRERGGGQCQAGSYEILHHERALGIRNIVADEREGPDKEV